MASLAVPGARAVRRRAIGGTGTALGETPEPWRRRDAAVVGLVVGLGVVGLIITWIGISGTARLTPQARWLGLGIASLLLAGFAMVGWLVLGLTRVAILRREVVRRLDRTEPVAEAAVTAEVPTGDRFGIATGMRRYHLAHCPLLAGKDVRWLDAKTLAFADTEPCGICAAPVVEL